MEFRWENAPIFLACLLGIVGAGLLIHYYIKRKVKSVTHDSQELLSLAAELAHLAPWQYHQETDLFEFDDAFYAFYATNTKAEGAFMTPQEYVRRFVHPEHIALVETEIDKILISAEKSGLNVFDHRIVRRDGEIRDIVVRVAFEKNHDGKMKKCYGVNQDITERKAMEAALQNSRDILSLAAELAKLGPWEYHPDKGLFEFGEEFYAIFGTTVEAEGRFKTIEEYIRDFVHPEDRGIFASTDLHKNYLHRIIRRDGEVRIVAVQANIVSDATGKIVQWYGATQDVTEHKQAEAALSRQTEQIRQIAFTDELTGLSTRTHMNEWVGKEMEQARCGTATGCVLFIDLDDLKTVNDTLGHSYGDAIIREAAGRIRRVFSPQDFVGRFGGDEFLVIVPGKSDRQAIAPVADTLIHELRREVEVMGEAFRLSASIGISIYPEDGTTIEELLKNVDNAMYYAKNSGKNCWKFYDIQMQQLAYEKMIMTKNLHRALENSEFELHYQPQINIADGRIVGFEALIRWRSPEDGLVPPDRFIPLAEQTGIIQAIGGWVLQEACRFARRLADNGWDSLYVAINVSPHQLCAEQFIESVHAAIDEAGIAPGRIEVEITENALIASLQEAISRLDRLKSLGVRLALDDFGSGYSSLTYLQQLPVQTLKIDKSFIARIGEGGAPKSIIGTIVEMAHHMNMTVVAEGVETDEQLAYLAKNRCDFVQGYLFSRPVPEEDALRFLAPH